MTNIDLAQKIGKHLVIVYACLISYDIYYGDVALGCRGGYVTMKATYNYVLYLIIDSLAWFVLALADLKIIMVSHVIDEFNFQ